MIGEDELITRIDRALTRRARPLAGESRRALVLGIGDDAAILRPGDRFDWVLSADFSLEGVHFLTAVHSPEAIGYRSLARAASDLAAMGAHPEFFLLSLALPRARCGRWLDRLLAGMARAARAYGLRLIGGDTTRRPQVTLALTVLGRVARGHALRRDGARPGDRLCVSGRLGAAALGLAVALRRLDKKNPRYRRLLRPHLAPSIPLALGVHLAERRLASAAIDLSDGLSTDLGRLARASGVRARVYADRLPAVRVPPALVRRGIDPASLALHGGEDYGLLFTVSRASFARLPASFRGTAITCIGEITRGTGVDLVDERGRAHPLRPAGWDPFRRRR
jgi:thiamine-monophosphate kinase